MGLPPLITENLDTLNRLCKQSKVRRLYAFGSVLTDQFDYEKSDLDLIVELEKMPPLVRGERLIALWSALEELFERRVDLLTDQPIRNSYLKAAINKTKQLIYDGESQEFLLHTSHTFKILPYATKK